MRKTLPMVVTFVVGLYALTEYFLPHRSVSVVSQRLTQWIPLIASTALILGAISLFHHHFIRIVKHDKDRYYSIVTLLATLITSVLGIGWGIEEGTPFKMIFDTIYKPLTTAMFSLLAFYLASAAFRTFRIRSFEAGLLFAAAFIVMLGRVPVGEWISPWIPFIADEWIMDIFTTSAMRAIRIGAGLGMATLSIKIILGMERTYIR